MDKVLIAGIAALSVLGASSGAAQTSGTLTLACQGEMESWSEATNHTTKEPVSFGISVNFTTALAAGIPSPSDVKIRLFETHIDLLGENLSGSIDRVTGRPQSPLLGRD